jgi:hypothetical protein
MENNKACLPNGGRQAIDAKFFAKHIRKIVFVYFYACVFDAACTLGQRGSFCGSSSKHKFQPLCR